MDLSSSFIEFINAELGNEAKEYFDSLSLLPVKGLHLNSYKTNEEELLKTFDGLARCENNCFEIKTDYLKRPSKHPFHACGLYYIQEPSAMLPVSLAPIVGNELALDLCAAPGGKSSQLASILKKGSLISNEKDKTRASILKENITRMGYSNVVVTSLNPKFFEENFESTFDLILVDAPCSGEGMFRKEPEASRQWSKVLVDACSSRQKEIINSGIKALKEGGILIYSTCTFSKEEDEVIAEYIIEHGFEEIKLRTVPAFLKECKFGYKCYPHKFGEGQYFAYFRKTIGKAKKLIKNKLEQANNQEIKQISVAYNIKEKILKNGDSFYLPALEIKIPCLANGTYLGKIENKRFVPNHAGALSVLDIRSKNENLSVFDERIIKYLNGEEIELSGNGWVALSVDSHPIGWVKVSNGSAKNHYPKSLRMRG